MNTHERLRDLARAAVILELAQRPAHEVDAERHRAIAQERAVEVNEQVLDRILDEVFCDLLLAVGEHREVFDFTAVGCAGQGIPILD